MHEKELSPGQKLNVLISDPTRKKERTDVNANQKELYVANLVRSVTEVDLRKAFEPVGFPEYRWTGRSFSFVVWRPKGCPSRHR